MHKFLYLVNIAKCNLQKDFLMNLAVAKKDTAYSTEFYVWVGQCFLIYTSSFAKSRSNFDDDLKIGDVRYDNRIQVTIKVLLFWRLPYEM